MLVREIMSSKVEWVAADQPVAKVARKMRDLKIGCLPVRENAESKIIGLITDRDITTRCVAEGLDPVDAPAFEIMSMEAAYCFDDQEVIDAIKFMEKKCVHRLPVLNRDKEMIGMLSLSDLAAHCTGDLWKDVAQAAAAYAH